MLEITSNKSVTTCFNISIYESWSIESNQLVVEISGKKYFCIYAMIEKDWNSDITQSSFDRVKNPIGKASLVSILKNGKAGNTYKDVFIYNANTFNGVFTHLFDAYNQELAKLEVQELVGAN